MENQLKRGKIYRYIKSQRLVSIIYDKEFGTLVFDMSIDLKRIIKMRQVKFLKQDTLETTAHIAEIIYHIDNNGFGASQLIRVVIESDLSPELWMSGRPLNELPVSPVNFITDEEYLWAGRRQPHLGCFIPILTFVIYGILFEYFPSVSSTFVTALLAFIVPPVVLIFLFNILFSKSADKEKINELIAYKQKLQDDKESQVKAAKGKFMEMLKKYETWEKLTPQEFEQVLSLRLEDEGYKVKVTQYAKDGGVDIEAKDMNGNPVIVQAKRYSKNVGVAVVRELIGVRESRPDKPSAIVYSLVGFTRGAKELAEKTGVHLRDVRSETLKI